MKICPLNIKTGGAFFVKDLFRYGSEINIDFVAAIPGLSYNKHLFVFIDFKRSAEISVKESVFLIFFLLLLVFAQDNVHLLF